MPTVKGKSVVTIHDTDFLDIPEYLDPEWVAYKDKFTRLSTKRAKLIITVSHYIKNKIVRCLKVPANKIRVIYHGVSKHFYPNKDKLLIKRITGKYGIMGPYILFVGTFHKNKNLIRLLEAFKHLKISTKLPHRLVLAGGKGGLYEDVLDSIVKFELTELVYLPEYISDEDLPILYNGADSFVFPSLFEGFGMPVLEAMACGTPVITSNLCSLPEVVGDAALRIDPYSTDSIAEGIYKVLSDSRLYNELVSRGLERAKQFSWEKTAKETLNVYRELCHQ
jgi:glycosyltransferase involved in cell wall biosynthesis